MDEGQQITRNLIPLDLLPEFIGYLSRRTGVPMETEVRANQNVDLKVKGPVAKLAFGVNHVLRATLPQRLHARIKEATLKVLSTKHSAAETSGVLDLPDVKAFVAEYYSADTEIFNRSKGRSECISTGLA